MSIRINSKELVQILDVTPREQNVLLVGRHGLGKSQILSRYFAEQGLRVVALFLGQMSDPGDLIGLPHKNAETGRTEFLPPSWWPVDGQPVALFLDELNRARPELLQSVHDLALNRRLAGRDLPAGSAVISAVNAGDEYQVTDLDPALASRFNIYEFVPEADEWVAWARRQGLDPRVIGFIEAHGAFLDGGPSSGDDPIEKGPDRRAWERVAVLLRPHEALSPLLTKAIAGVVGVPAAMAFLKFVHTQRRVTPEALLLHFDDAVGRELLAMALPEIVQLNRQALSWVDEQAGQGSKLAAARRQKIVGNFERYLGLLQKSGKTELLADLITQIERGEFSRASAMLLVAPGILKLLTDYIGRVKL